MKLWQFSAWRETQDIRLWQPPFTQQRTFPKVSSLYIAQIKKKCGLDVGENFNLPKSENARQPQCTPEKEEAIMQAFKHFGIV